MFSYQLIFATVLGLTIASAAVSVALILSGNDRRARRLVAVRLAQIALVGAAAIASLLRLVT